ncbi:MAG: pyridoxal phosphate-dependent aminotransferase family protein [Sulfurospirillum sp.]|nr:pyridoxal phosphate-dependent aminotransferase family protein [Sulfurospirillum sp.]
MMYQKELDALQKAHRFRQKTAHPTGLIDLASNDYLGLAGKKQLLKRAYQSVAFYDVHAPKSSLMVNGYHQIHKDFENFLCRQNGFEAAHLLGSGFLANLSLLEALPRRGDMLLIDEEYHASGVMGSKLCNAKVIFFRHNDALHVRQILQTHSYERVIIAVEGIYSMSGDIVDREFFDIATEYEALLIVDEAHSSGILGVNLLGVFEHYGIEIKQNFIKMGTLGKAYGSYGAYILCSLHVSLFLQNRAKAMIYSTAVSLFDIALAHQSMLYIQKHKKELALQIAKRQMLVREYFDQDMAGLILKLEVGSSKEVLALQAILREKNFFVGAIRPPTYPKAMLRVIPKIDVSLELTCELFASIKEEGL